jgi:hypothetical protein
MGKKGKKSTITMHTWAISRIKGTPAVEIGWVDAPDAETAIMEAIERTKFEMVVNLTTAKNGPCEIPPGLLIRADEVIE